MGQNWYQTAGTGNALILRRWTFFFNHEGPPYWISPKTLLPPKLLVILERIGEALKVVYGAYQFAETWY